MYREKWGERRGRRPFGRPRRPGWHGEAAVAAVQWDDDLRDGDGALARLRRLYDPVLKEAVPGRLRAVLRREG